MKWLALFTLKLWLIAREWALTILNTLEGSILMMAMLFACRVIEGRTEFDVVPRLLKQQVADIIINDFKMPEIIPVEFGGTLGAE